MRYVSPSEANSETLYVIIKNAKKSCRKLKDDIRRSLAQVAMIADFQFFMGIVDFT